MIIAYFMDMSMNEEWIIVFIVTPIQIISKDVQRRPKI